MQLGRFWYRLQRFEYWPVWAFYGLLVPFWVRAAVRARAVTYFSNVNEGMDARAPYREPKFRVLSKIPAQYLPPTLWIPAHCSEAKTLEGLEKAGIAFPLIAKPDIGERGVGVQKIRNREALRRYLQESAPLDRVLQALVALPQEFGVFYSRLPGEAKGQISGITQKDFMAVWGDGQHSIRQLMAQQFRYRQQIVRMEEVWGFEKLEEVLPMGHRFLLEPIGNHNRGTIFLSRPELITAALSEQLDQVAQQMEGFYFGRFDLKAPSEEDLMAFRGVKILELNTANSEPTHIYHPGTPLRQGAAEVVWHWNRMARISRENKRQGFRPWSVGQTLGKMWRHFLLKDYQRSPEAAAGESYRIIGTGEQQ